MEEKDILFSAIKDGDWKAFTSCFQQYAEQLYLYASGFLGDQEEARDIVQDVFIYVWENREKLTFSEHFSAYLFRAVKHACVDYKLHEKVKERYQNEKKLADECEDVYEDDFDEQYLRLQQVIGTLPPKCKEVFILGCVEELSYKKIAERLDLSINTVKTQMKIAYKKIKSDFGDGNVMLLGVLFGNWLN